MKQLLVVAIAAFALAAHADWKPTYTVRLADTDSLSKGIAKLGEFTGNQMIGMMAAGMMNDLPGAAVFGPARKGTGILFPFFVENGRSEFGILYPVSVTKKEFFAKFPKAVESNGLIRVKCQLIGKKKSVNYVAFSEDGKWAGVSDKPQQARLALGCIKDAEKSMDGDLVKVIALKRGIEQWAQGGEKEKSARVRDLVAQIDGVVFGLRVSEKGLDVRGIVKPAKESELSKVGQKAVAADALSFAGKDAVFASANAADCGCEAEMSVLWKEVKAILEEEDLKTDWLEFTEKGANSKFTLDLDKLFAYAKILDEEADKDDKKELGEKILSVCKKSAEKKNNTLFKAAGPAANYEFAIKGYSGKSSLADRFAYTLPEAAGKQSFSVGFFSFYTILRTVIPAVAKADPDSQADLNQVMALLPEEGKGGMAMMLWREKDLPRFFFRIGADEFKAVSAGFAAMAIQSRKTKSGKAGAVVDDDDPDDDLD